MLYITTKLRRLKFLRVTASVVLLPLRFPLMAIWKLGEWSLFVDQLVFQSSYHKVEKLIIKKFKWNEIAKKQNKVNPKKFR